MRFRWFFRDWRLRQMLDRGDVEEFLRQVTPGLALNRAQMDLAAAELQDEARRLEITAEALAKRIERKVHLTRRSE